MSWTDVKDFIDNFRTDRIMQLLQEWNVGDLTTNPWFLGGFATVVLITYFLGMRAISAFLVGIGGFTLALAYTVRQGTGTGGLEGGGLYVIIGGGTVAIGLFIYLLFIKSE
jgi:hypothetical protein